MNKLKKLNLKEGKHNLMNTSFFEKKESESVVDRLTQDPENMLAALFVIAMAVYYLFRMVFLTPWYDELYTYYCFISKGPIYSALHWPLPNNHVGYSVLSGFLNLFGNSIIGLRGVSYAAAVSNLILLYRLMKKNFSRWISFCGLLLYCSFELTNTLSVQGRGYTLSITCLLLSVWVMLEICNADSRIKSRSAMLVVSLTLGLYTLPSAIYWVVPTCMAVVFFLFVNGIRVRKSYKRIRDNMYFKRLMIIVRAGIEAALLTVFLYLIIWLSIGSNLLTKNSDSIYYGLGHIKIILTHPITAVKEGIDYMLSMPYIQSVSRQVFNDGAKDYFISLCDSFLSEKGLLIIFVCMVSLILLIISSLKHFEESRTCLRIVLAFNIISIPLFLYIQCKLPYNRVFSYMGVIIAASAAVLIRHICDLLSFIFHKINLKKDLVSSSDAHEKIEEEAFERTGLVDDISFGRQADKIAADYERNWVSGGRIFTLGSTGHRFQWVGCIICGVFLLAQILTANFWSQIGDRENKAYLALYMADLNGYDNICVTDCDQQYLLEYGWNIRCDNTQIEDSDCVILDRNMMNPDYAGEDYWKFYQTYDTIPWDYIETMHVMYENDRFVLYVK